MRKKYCVANKVRGGGQEKERKEGGRKGERERKKKGRVEKEKEEYILKVRRPFSKVWNSVNFEKQG